MAYVENNPVWFFQMKILITFACATLIFNRESVSAAALFSEPIFNNFTNIGDGQNDKKNECTSQICTQEANFFRTIMKDDVDPCDDFYEFTCGKYIANTVLQDAGEALIINAVQTSIDDGLKSELTNCNENDPNYLKKLKLFYNGCQESATEERINDLLQILNNAGGIPVLLGEQWNETAFDWMDTVSKLKGLGFSMNFPVNVNIQIDPVNFRTRKISITLPDSEFFEPLLNYEEQEELQNDTLKNHYQHIVNFAVQRGINETVALAEMEAIFLFERNLLRIHLSELHENPASQQFYRSIKSLDRRYSVIPWLNFFKVFAPDADVDENEKIITPSHKSLTSLARLIEVTPKRVVSNYIMMQAMVDVQKHLPNEFLRLESPPNRPKICWDTTRDYFGLALSALYVQKFVKNGTRESAVHLVQDIKNEFKELLRTNNWMDRRAKSVALEKLEAMKFMVGYPDEYLDNEKLDERYTTFEIDSVSFLKTLLNAYKYDAAISAANLRKPVNKSDWTQLENVHAEEINSYYLPYKNYFEIAAASLRQPLFDPTRPQYLNYGMLGSIIGHEISHGFGMFGREFDQNGNLSNWWSSDTTENYEVKSKCFIDQFNNYTIQPFGLNLNGAASLEENIADNGGLKAAYYAYMHWSSRNNITEPLLPGLRYNPRQMFWINAASFNCAKYDPESLKKKIIEDQHSPEEARVRLTFSNIREFAEDFKCDPGSKMNPVNKCVLW